MHSPAFLRSVFAVAMLSILGAKLSAQQLVSDLTIQRTLKMPGDISPSQITSDQNNYAPTNFSSSSILRLSTDASRTITGLAGGSDGLIKVLCNVGSNALVLAAESSSSTAANRFALASALTLSPGGNLAIIYDSTSSRWRILYRPLETSSVPWASVDKTGSSLADLVTRSASDLSSGTLADARLSTNVVTLTGSQTLTNKTLTSPVIGTISNTGTITLPTSTDTLVGRATTDTLTNKSISGSSNTLTNLPASGISGVIPIANLATGTPNGTKFLRDDGTLATPAGAGTVTNTAGDLTSNAVMIGNGTTDAKVLAALGNSGDVLTSTGAGSPPAFAAPVTYDLTSTLVSSEVSVTGATTLTSTAFGKMHVCTGTSADYTVGLPAVSGNTGKIIGIRMAMALTKLVTIDGNSSETIDGATTRIMWAGESAILLCNGTEWIKVAGKSRAMSASSERTTGVSIATGGTTVAVPVNSMINESNSGMVDTANGKVFIRRPGTYIIDAFMSYEDGAHAVGNAQSYCFVCVNSTTADTTGPSALAVVPTSTASGGTYSHVNCTVIRPLSAGDYIAIAGQQNTGNTLTTRTPTSVRPHLNLTEAITW